MDNLFEYTLSCKQVKFRYARGQSLADGNEFHAYHEILYYKDGGAAFLAENYCEELTKGTLLIIPRESYHQFDIKNQNCYTRLVLNFPESEVADIAPNAVDGIRVFKNPNSHIYNILERMCSVLSGGQDSAASRSLMYGLYISLISEISLSCSEAELPMSRDKNSVAYRCVQYIDDNCFRQLSVEKIAAEINVSPSSLFHTFKAELGISLYKYITEKRLIYAHRLISSGEKPTKIYMQCGFNDYSCFYKAFVKMFGHPPSAKSMGGL
ncbi:MAG: helix-turn-helix transcriptional regulator [Clostridia bacterium]|nr:helix-turn-helix transcriptional regulator [Clostridia bacterium]